MKLLSKKYYSVSACPTPILHVNVKGVSQLIFTKLYIQIEMSIKSRLPRLVLHFDVNETILLGDVAGGDSFEDAINKCIAKSALISYADSSCIKWYDGSSMDSGCPPPLMPNWIRPEKCTSYYEYFRKSLGDKRKLFTLNGPGRGYRPVYEEVEQALRWPKGATKPTKSLCQDGIHHFLIPGFFKTLTELQNRGREFSVVIRTFGDDLDDLVACVNDFAQGKHLPEFQAYPGKTLDHFHIAPENVWKGRYDENGNFNLINKANDSVISNENEVVKLLQGGYCNEDSISIIACQDDYEHWAQHNYHPSAGKPLWITKADDRYHHIFFDDNIKNNEEDSIVAARIRETSADDFKALDGKSTLRLHGIHLVKVPTYAAVLDKNWFLKAIDACEKKRMEEQLVSKSEGKK